MEVIAHYGKAKDIDTELSGEEPHAVLNPLPAVFVILPGQRVFAAQERASHATIDAMVDADFGGIDQKPATDSWHGVAPA
jgi:hypothetical protein